MGRTKKVRTEEELVALLDAAEKRRQDADRRAQEARKSEAEAKKRLEELRAAERQRRMMTLLNELKPLGFTLDSDDDIQRIVEKIQNPEPAEYGNDEHRLLHDLAQIFRSRARLPMRTAEDIDTLMDVLLRDRMLSESSKPIKLITLIGREYKSDQRCKEQLRQVAAAERENPA